MKKQYKLLLSIFAIEIFLVSILGKTQSVIGNAIELFIVFLPLEILLFMLGRDENFNQRKRKYFKFAFWGIVFFYVLCIEAYMKYFTM